MMSMSVPAMVREASLNCQRSTVTGTFSTSVRPMAAISWARKSAAACSASLPADFLAREAERLEQDQRQQMEEFCRGYGLTEREREILRLILAGKDNLEISEELQIKMGTVKAHVHNIFTKLNISRRSELMKRFLDYGPEEEASEPAPADQP